MKVVFCGSPDFAAASLKALLASRHRVVGVITQPDRPAGRGLELTPSAVKALALEYSLPIFQPEKINTQAAYDWLASLNADVLCVVAYGEFLGSRLLDFFSTPPINVHPSLLPDLRGAAPMQWSLLNGYTRSGVTTQFMAKEMDAGDILLQQEVAIGADENCQELQDRLKFIGGDLLVKTLNLLEEKSLHPRAQDSSRATFAPLLTKEQGKIDWFSSKAIEIHNKVRGLFPWPSAYTFLRGKRCKILRTRLPDLRAVPQCGARAGEFHFFGDAMFVRAQDQWLEIISLQPEGKRPLLPREFANGMNNQASQFDLG